MKVTTNENGIVIHNFLSKTKVSVEQPYMYVLNNDLVYVIHNDKMANNSVAYVYDKYGSMIDMRRYNFLFNQLFVESGQVEVTYLKGSMFKAEMSNATLLNERIV